MCIKILYIINNNEKNSVGRGAIFKPKTLSWYFKKMTKTGLEPATFGLENLPSYPLG